MAEVYGIKQFLKVSSPGSPESNTDCPIVVYYHNPSVPFCSVALCAFDLGIGLDLSRKICVGENGIIQTRMWKPEGDLAVIPSRMAAILYMSFAANKMAASRFVGEFIEYKFTGETELTIKLPASCGDYTLVGTYDNYTDPTIDWELYKSDDKLRKNLCGGAYDKPSIEFMMHNYHGLLY